LLEVAGCNKANVVINKHSLLERNLI
jgi:hypothetical protein